MATLAKLVRLQPRSSLSSFRLQASRTLTTSSVATARLHRPSLKRAVPSSWSPVSMRFFSEENTTSRREKLPPSRGIFVTRIPYNATSEHLYDIFSPYGVIDRVYIFPSRLGGHKGCGRVEFNRLEDAIAVYESGEIEPFYLMDQTLIVDYSRGHTLAPKTHILFFRDFMGNKKDLRNILEDYEDDIVQMAFTPPFKAGQLWDRGHIHFCDADTAEEVLNKFNGKMTAIGCPLNLEYSVKKDTTTPKPKRNNRD